MFPAGGGSQISRKSAHGGGKIVILTYRPSLTPLLIYYSLRRHEGQSAPEVLYQCKIPTKTSAIEPATIVVVAQCLNQLHHPVTTIVLYEKYCCRNESLQVEKS